MLAYVPEAIFTYAYFAFLMPLFLASEVETAFIVTVLIKATGEVIIMSVIIAALMGNKGFNDFVRAFFSAKRTTPRVSTAEK